MSRVRSDASTTTRLSVNEIADVALHNRLRVEKVVVEDLCVRVFVCYFHPVSSTLKDPIKVDMSEVNALSASYTLPCGVVVPNRLAKAPMEEMLGPAGGGDPQPQHLTLYEEWAKGGWGMNITGNVMVSARSLGTPFDVVVPSADSPTYKKSLTAFKSWAEASHRCEKDQQPPTVVMQLCHTGRQSMRGSGRPLSEPSLAPSAIPLQSKANLSTRIFGQVAWGTPKAMTEKDIDEVVEQFVQGATVAKEAGFDGVQVHASHGYLLAQFISPNVNLRTDSYGGSARNRMKIVFRIIDAIRAKYPDSSRFIVGIKLNSADFVEGGLTEEDALMNVQWLAEHGGLDFIDISGGTYENAAMLGEDVDSKVVTPSARSATREAFFVNFASRARTLLKSLSSSSLPTPAPSIMVTGGFRTRQGMAEAITSGAADFVGIGRPACADPKVPLKLLDASIQGKAARTPKYNVKGTQWISYLPIKLLLPGVNTIFHTLLLAQASKGETPDVTMSLPVGLWRVYLKDSVAKGAWWWLASVMILLGVLGQRFFS